MRRTRRRTRSALVAVMLAGGGLLAGTVPAAAAPAAAVDCAVTWGSLDKSGAADAGRRLTGVRAGQHECFDRLVFDGLGTGDEPIGYTVRYVDVLHQDPSDVVVPVKGGAVLEISLFAPRYDPATGQPYPALPSVDVTGYRTFREFKVTGGSEGYTQAGLGVRARLPFRVFRTGGRLVVDVAHTW
ncbi:AMIN-like domain-containing (lipo)protein [Streptomyces sp. NPDC001414]